ncbi:MAG: hypothetical protein ACK5ES_12995 [Planctomyces sp.]|jgi:hypothetical protein
MNELSLGFVGGVGATLLAFFGGVSSVAAIALIVLGAAIATVVQLFSDRR